MSTRTLAMSNSLPPTTRQPGFVRRLIMLLLFAAGIVFWMNVLSQHQTNLPEILMTVFADGVIALAAGLGARIAFYERSWFTRLISALGSMVIGLFALGYVTNWKIGIGPIEFWRDYMDWAELAQLGGGTGVVLLGLYAWWRPSARWGDTQNSPRNSAWSEAISAPQSSEPSRSTAPRFRFPGSWTSRPKSGLRLRGTRQARSSQRLVPEIERVVVSRPVKLARSGKRRKLFQRKPDMQISVFEDHRCPYCLDTVKRNDPRGVKECDVCHSLHHADCWNITGMCQVPHLNA